MIKEVTDQSLAFKKDDGSAILTVQQKLNTDENTCIVFLDGEITNEVFSGLADELYALMSIGLGVILDMKNVSFLSQGFMEALIQLEHRAEHGEFETMPIQNVSKALYDKIREAGFANSLDIELQEDA